MASMTMTMTIPPPYKFPQRLVASPICFAAASSSSLQRGHSHASCSLKQQHQLLLAPRFMYGRSPGQELEFAFRGMVCAAATTGLEASIDVETKKGDIKVNATVNVEYQDEEKIQLRVDVTGAETDKVFNLVLRNLASTAPPIPGFRRQKGGKTTQVPKDFLLNVLGEERVTKFVIQEIVSTTVADYVKKENLIVKENKLNTTQTLEELLKIFSPGKEFGFNANLELERESDDEPAALQEESESESDIIDLTVESESNA